MSKKLLRIRSVKDLTGLSGSTIDRMIKAGKFPAPIKLTGARAVAWNAEEVEAWIQSRIDESRGGASQ